MTSFAPAARSSPSHNPAPSARCQRCAARLHCLVGQLPSQRHEWLDAQITEIDVQKGTVLQVESATEPVVRVVKLGTVMLTRTGPDGVGRPVGLTGRGHLLGLWRLLDQPTHVGAVAVSAGRICELPLPAMQALLQQESTFLGLLHNSLAHSCAHLADWGQLMRLRGLPRQLVAALLLLAQAQGAAAMRLPSQVAMAALLNTSRESVARALQQLEIDGFLHRIDRWHAELRIGHRAVFGPTTVGD